MKNFAGKPPSMFKRLRWKIRGYIPFSNWWVVWRKLDKTSGSILDLGCGVGSPMKFINRHKQFYTVGIDGFQPYIIQVTLEKTYNLAVQSDIIEYCKNCKEDSFDTVICLQTLEHLDKPDGEYLMNRMDKIARKQVIIVTDINEYVQGIADNNTLQIHRYIWDIKELKARGYYVNGLGIRGYGGETGISRLFPGLLRWTIAIILQTAVGLFVYHYPKNAGAVVCIKNLKEE